jgi:hypothetical protein
MCEKFKPEAREALEDVKPLSRISLASGSRKP